VARCAFGAGFLTGSVDEQTDFAADDRRSWQSDEAKHARAEQARALAFLRTEGRTGAQNCIKFPLSFDAVSTVIAGSKSLEHMRENAAASDAPDFTDEELERIEQVLGRA
jgi:aryl-alcohol dehydrogenase-like predicted oxidoreductase